MSNAVDAPGQSAAAAADEFIPLPRRQVVLTMAGVMLGMFLAALDQTVVSTALPRIIADLGGLDRFTWTATAYLVASTTAVPIVGRLTDIYGRKYFYLAGLIVFLLGSVLAGLSQTMNQLIAFRAVQGLGGGVIFANAFVSIADLFPPAERGKYQGLVAAVFGVASVVGPTLGGFLTDTLSWHWIFYINLPLGIPIIVLFIIYFPNTRRDTGKRQIDYLGMVLLIATVVAAAHRPVLGNDGVRVGLGAVPRFPGLCPRGGGRCSSWWSGGWRSRSCPSRSTKIAPSRWRCSPSS